MAKKGQRIYVMLECTHPEGRKHRYYTSYNRVNKPDGLGTMKKFNPYLNQHVDYIAKKLK